MFCFLNCVLTSIYKCLGVEREPSDRRGDFKIFDDPKTPYSTFNFQYSNEAFDKLHDLMEFNTLLHIEVSTERSIFFILYVQSIFPGV